MLNELQNSPITLIITITFYTDIQHKPYTSSHRLQFSKHVNSTPPYTTCPNFSSRIFFIVYKKVSCFFFPIVKVKLRKPETLLDLSAVRTLMRVVVDYNRPLSRCAVTRLECSYSFNPVELAIFARSSFIQGSRKANRIL